MACDATDPIPEIAVVIPTHNRETRLAFALDALAEQTMARDRFEVIVVRSAAQEGPFTAAPAGLDVRFLTTPGSSGPTDKRNLGWRSTRAPLIAFTDDDCRPQTDWLERLAEAADDETLLQGRTQPDPDEAHLLRGLARSQSVTGPNPWYPACNLAYPRKLLEAVGGLDEAYSFGGEDTDLALRVLSTGATARYIGDAVVDHCVVSRSLTDALRDAVAWPTFPLVLSKHPEQRQYLYLSVFRNEAHALLYLALAGVALRRRAPRFAFLAAMPYIHHHLRGALVDENRSVRMLARSVAHLAPRLLVDLVESAATLASGATHRVFVA